MWNYNDPYLCHYGVLGMRWGHHKRQDMTVSRSGVRTKKAKEPSESVATAQKNKKAADEQYGKAYDKFRRIRKPTEADKKEYDSAMKQKIFCDRELSDAKNRDKMQMQEKVSKRQQSFKQKYEEQGLTSKEAELAAYKRVRTEKIIAVTAGVAITAAAAYVAYKHYDNNVDKIIKQGTLLQNISTVKNKGVNDAFYASHNMYDNAKYRGLYGQTLRVGSLYRDDVYETKFKVTGDLKLASRKSAAGVFKEMMDNDPQYANDVKQQITNLASEGGSLKQIILSNYAKSSLENGEVNNAVYDALNLSLANHTTLGNKVSSGLYDALKSKGYDAIKDVNDSKYSGYATIDPVIVFNGQAKVASESFRKLTDSEIDTNHILGMADINARDFVKKVGVVTAVGTAIGAKNSRQTKKREDELVRNYRKEHPESELSYNEIVRNSE